MEMLKKREEDMYRLLEIYDGYEMVQDISDSLLGCSYSAGYDEGILGKLAHVVKLIVERADPSLYDRKLDFLDTDLARILDDRELDNHIKAEFLLGVRK